MKKLDEDYGTGRSVVVVVRTAAANFSEVDLCALRTWLSDQLFEDAHLINASSPFDLKRVDDQAGYMHYRPLFDLNCESPNQSPDPRYWNSLRNSPFAKLFVSPTDSRFLLFELNYDGAVRDPAMGAFSPEKRLGIQASLEAAIEKSNLPLKVTLSGAGTYESFLVNGMRVYGWINLLITVFIVVAFRWLYRTWRSSAIYLVLLGTGMVVTFAAVGLSGRPLDILSNSLFVMTAVAALQDFAFLTSSIRSGQVWESYRRLLVPSFFTSLTTMLGFGSLAISDIASIRWFGIWAALAAFLEWVLLFIILPAAMTLWPSLSRWTRKSASFEGQFQTVPSVGKRNFGLSFASSRFIFRLAVVLFLVVFPMGIGSLFFLNVQDDPKRMLPESHPFRLQLSTLKEDLGWEFPVAIVFPDGRNFELIHETTAKVRSLPEVAAVESLSQISEWMSNGLSNETADVVMRDAVSRGTTRRYQTSTGDGRIILYLRSANLSAIANLKNKVESDICGKSQCRLVGEVVAYADFVRSVSETLFESLTSGLLSVVTLILLLAFVRLDLEVFPYAAPRLIASLLWGPLGMLSLLALSQVALNMVTLICASVVVGLTGDNAIQFLFARRIRTSADLLSALSEKSEGAFVTGVLTAIASLVFLFSYFDPPRVLGLLLFCCFLMSVVGDTFGLRLLMGSAGLEKPAKTRAEG